MRAFPYDANVIGLAAFLLFGLAACAPSGPRTVPRVVDGQVEQGPVVSPYAYEWFIEGEISAANGEHEEAAIAFENATAAPAADVLLMARLAEEYEKSGASRRADRALALARRSYPDSARLALAEGVVLRIRGDDEGAISSLVRARRLAPTWDEPVMALANTLRAGGHVLRANAILLDYVATAPEEQTVDARRLLIDLARRAGNAGALAQALALDPGVSREARAAAAGRLALDTGRPALAARILEQAPTTENVEPWVHALVESGARAKAAAFVSSPAGKRLGKASDRAELLIAVGDEDRALLLLQPVRPSPAARYARGHALESSGRYVDAASVLANVPFGAADFEAARLLLADCASSQARGGAAAELLSMVPHDSLAVRERLARTYLDAGMLRPVLRLFDPKVSAERAALAKIFERAGRFEEAAAYYATVAVRTGDDPQLQARATSEQLASHGHYPSAIAILEQWTAVAPEDLYARVRLVELLLADGDVEEARQEGRRVLNLIADPLLRSHLIELLSGSAAGSVLPEQVLDSDVQGGGDLVE